MHTRLTLVVDCFRVDIEPRKLPTASLCKRNTNNHAVYKADICNIRYLTILCVKQVEVDSRCTRLSYSVCWLVSSVSDRWTSLKVRRFVVVHEEKNQILIIMLSFTFCDAGILPPLLMLMLLLLLLYFVLQDVSLSTSVFCSKVVTGYDETVLAMRLLLQTHTS